MTWQAILGPAIVAAIVAGLINILRDARLDRRRRRERVTDVQHALIAEIRAYCNVLQRDDLPAFRDRIVAEMDRDPAYFPFIPTERNSTVFDALVGEIHVLPRGTIDPVVVYYSQLHAIAAMIDDLRGLDHTAVPRHRAVRMYEDYIEMKMTALAWGEEAIAMMETYLRDGDTGLELRLAQREAVETERLRSSIPSIRTDVREMATRVSTPVSDPSGR